MFSGGSIALAWWQCYQHGPKPACYCFVQVQHWLLQLALELESRLIKDRSQVRGGQHPSCCARGGQAFRRPRGAVCRRLVVVVGGGSACSRLFSCAEVLQKGVREPSQQGWLCPRTLQG